MVDPSDNSESWSGYQKLVLSELKRLDSGLMRLAETLEKTFKHESANRRMVDKGISDELQLLERNVSLEIEKIKIAIHGLHIKAGVWGMGAGLIPVLTALILKQI